MEVQFKENVCKFLNIPSIPLKEWDGKSSFKDGVAITQLADNVFAYAVCTFDANVDKMPRIVKVFAQETFFGIAKIFVVPAFMNTDVETMDLDEESKKAAERLVQDAKEIEKGDEEKIELPQNEYSFDHIHNDEEAIAFITAYNKENNIRGAVPTKHDTIVMRLSVIYAELQKKGTKKKKRR